MAHGFILHPTLSARGRALSPSSSGTGTQLSLLEGDCVGLTWPKTEQAGLISPAFFLVQCIQRSFARDKRNAFPMTLTDDSAIAAAPTIGDSKIPNTG